MTDPGIILFGKKIGLPPAAGLAMETTAFSEERKNREDEHTLSAPQDQRKDESDDNPKTPSIDEEGTSENHRNIGISGETSNSQPRTLTKPDKILPCPRCDSMNTKFCYYNNSNINQPRHFCKSCQRYWTAGGSMRNMPVGAGRRKKKTPASNCRFIIPQEAFELKPANYIEFASDLPNSTQFGANLSVGENRDGNNGFHSQVRWIPIPAICPPGYPPMPIYHSPHWSSVSWLPPAGSILGKHSTDDESIKPNGCHVEAKKQRNSILIPKTLRIDDPDEAAKSSIWATLGIKNESSGRGDLFKAFQAKVDEKKKDTATESCPALQANPAAFSRSRCFQERA